MRHQVRLHLSNKVHHHDDRNHTSFDYSRCNTYVLEWPESSDRSTTTLTVKFSFIAHLRVSHWTVYDRSGKSGAVFTPEAPWMLDVQAALENVCADLGFRELSRPEGDVLLPGVELELSEPDRVTVEKCLFDDHAS